MTISERQKYIGNTAIGLTGGVAAYAGGTRIAINQYLNLLKKCSRRYTTNEQNTIWNAGLKAFNNSPIKDKVQIVNYNISNWEAIADTIVEKRKNFLKNNKNLLIKLKALTWPSDEKLKESFFVYAQGKNACYMPSISQILVNKEKKANTIFHEIGHAVNAKGVGLGNYLHAVRGKFSKYVPFIFGMSMLIPKNNKENPTKNKYYQWLLNFKKYSGLIASACLIPLVTEEGLASINGGKIAKKVLSEDLYKRVTNSNIKSFSTYVVLMITTGVGITLANYIKDKITGPLPNTNKTSTQINNQELMEK